MKKIKNIIVPTDFSDTARNAYHYARQLAETLDAKITVVHVNEYILPGAESIVTAISDLEIFRLTEESMEMFVAEEEAADDYVLVKNKVKTKLLRGDLIGRLVELSQDNATDLMVIGTTGKQGFFGSTALSVANQAHCPVVLVPHKAVWHPLQRIMYASNYDSLTPKMIEEVTLFAQSFDATIHFVHVNNFDSETENDIAEINWDALFPMTKSSPAFDVHSIYGNDKIAELKKYASKHKINMIAFVSKHRSFWKNLMHKSVTDNISLSTDTPLMVIHLDDREHKPSTKSSQ